jgi:fumarate reductase subunit D
MKDQDLTNNLENGGINGVEPGDEEEGYTAPKDEEEIIEEGKAAAILGYVPFLCFIPLIKMRENPFAFRHGKQGLFLFFVEILAVFFMFDIISNLFWGMLLILSVGSAVAGILYAIQGKEFTIPFIGDTADKLKI